MAELFTSVSVVQRWHKLKNQHTNKRGTGQSESESAGKESIYLDEQNPVYCHIFISIDFVLISHIMWNEITLLCSNV